MPKTYTSVPSVSTGDVYQASTYNTYTAQNLNNLIVPPACQLRRTTNLTSYASNTDITFDTTANYDTDGMFSSGTPTTITIQTTGLYLVSFTGLLTGTATMTNFDSLLFKSGSEIVRNGHWSSATGAYFAMHATVSLTAADTLTARLITVGGSAYVVGGNASNGSQTRFTATWIGRTS